MAQAGTVYRYFRADADKDISGDTFEMSLDETTWHAATYIAPISWPPSVTAGDAASPAAAGFTGYWYRILTGPATSFPLNRGANKVYGRATDSPEIPHFGWRVDVLPTE